MKRRLRRFVGVALLVTAVDIGLLLVLGSGFDVPWPVADLLSVAVATVVSYVVHRAVTVPTGPFATIEHRPFRFLAATGPAALVDVVLFTVAWAIWEPWSAVGAVVAKLVTLAVAGTVRVFGYRRLLWQTVRDQQAAPTHPPRAVGAGGIRVSVVLPAYRAEGVVAGSVAAVSAALGDMGDGTVEIVVVDDGSPDDTAARARAAGAHQVIRLPENRGKGAAVRAGMLAAGGDAVVFTDVDLAYEPDQIRGLVAALEEGYDVAVGSRRHPDTRTVVATGRLRELGSAVFNLMTYLTLLGAYRDTQSGLKGFRRGAARQIFGRTLIDGFAFDVEVLHLVERDGLSLVEVPVTVEYGSDSTVRLAAEAVRMMRDVLRVRRWSAEGRYDVAGGRGERLGSIPADMTAIDAIPEERLASIFKAYDIRGTVPDQLDAGIVRAVGAAFARFTAAPELLVGRDMRPDGVEFAAAFAEGACSQGADVVDLGLASTDLVYAAAGLLDRPAAMLTASHNPAGYNGIKLCGAGATPVGTETGLADIQRLAASGMEGAASTGSVRHVDFLGRYVEHVHSFIDEGSLRPLKVVADCANGMGGLVAPAVFAGLPLDVELLYPELDGTFPNHPADPINPANLVDLQARVLAAGADVGLAFDGDADRVFLVDEQARLVSGSLTTALVAKGVLAKEPGATVLYNLICSRAVPEVIGEAGGTAVRTKVGHSYIKAVMAETGAAFGGEHSGHYYFRDNFRADSGIIAALVVLEQMSTADRPLSALLVPLDRYAASGEINTEVDDLGAVIERVAAHYAGNHQDRVDGLTVDCGPWWFNLRPSNTEPLLRLNLEAPTPAEVAERVDEVRALF